ncbi:eCIS core domain-containing protein [Streptomyces sp. NPDC004270]
MHARAERDRSSDERDTAQRVIRPSALVQRMLDLQQTAGNTAVARMVEQERHQHGPGCEHVDPAVQRREATGHRHDGAEDTHPTAHRSLIDAAMATPSSPLPGPFLTKAKAFYGNDALSAGRVHDNTTAQRATAALGAQAMTIGSHIFLGSSAVGDTEVLAHETSHLDKNLRGIRETGNDNGAGVTVTDPGQGSERAAVADGAAFTAGAATAPSVVAQRAVAHEADGAERTAQRVPDAGTAEVRDGGSYGGTAVQRTVWEFDQAASFSDPRLGQETRWRNRSNQDDVRTATQLGINGQGAPRHGDVYDDATQQVHSSANARFSKKGTIPDREYPQRESQTRRALVEAKQAITTALALLTAAGNAPGGRLLTALQSAFPAFRAATPEQVAAFLPRIVEVVRRIQAGLNAQGAEIALVGEGNVPRGVAGWVGSSWYDVYSRVTNPDQQKSEELPTLDTGRSGPINLTDEGQNAWYIIHEATHRFAGTLDYQYSPRASELQEEEFNAEMATIAPEAAAASDAATLAKRALRDPAGYSGENNDSSRQPNWYAMGRRALMNADSYAQFVLTAAGARAPRF